MKESVSMRSFSYACRIIFLQIAILLSSIAALMKKKAIWFIGVATGTIGIIYFANGFLLFF
jgi:hypothetical protein